MGLIMHSLLIIGLLILNESQGVLCSSLDVQALMAMVDVNSCDCHEKDLSKANCDVVLPQALGKEFNCHLGKVFCCRRQKAKSNVDLEIQLGVEEVLDDVEEVEGKKVEEVEGKDVEEVEQVQEVEQEVDEAQDFDEVVQEVDGEVDHNVQKVDQDVIQDVGEIDQEQVEQVGQGTQDVHEEQVEEVDEADHDEEVHQELEQFDVTNCECQSIGECPAHHMDFSFGESCPSGTVRCCAHIINHENIDNEDNVDDDDVEEDVLDASMSVAEYEARAEELELQRQMWLEQQEQDDLRGQLGDRKQQDKSILENLADLFSFSD